MGGFIEESVREKTERNAPDRNGKTERNVTDRNGKTERNVTDRIGWRKQPRGMTKSGNRHTEGKK
jgi:hypothetical protein